MQFTQVQDEGGEAGSIQGRKVCFVKRLVIVSKLSKDWKTANRLIIFEKPPNDQIVGKIKALEY